MDTSSEKLTPIAVPPLKSMPRFTPIRRSIIDPNANTDERPNPNDLNFIKLILVFSMNFIIIYSVFLNFF